MMKKLFALLVALCLLCPAALADSEITVQGRGVVRTAPDIVVISLGAEEYGEDVAAIQAAVNGRIDAIIDALKAADVAQEDIQTANYSIYRRFYDDNGNPTRDYTASCQLNVTVRDIDKAGDVIDLAFTAGANTLGNVTFSVDDDGSLSDKALALAVADGVHRAQVIAAAAGVTLPAAPSRVAEGANAYYDAMNTRVAAESVAAKGVATQLMSGMVEISATVTVTYEIKD